MEDIDSLRLTFNEDNLFILNLCLGFIMFGVALDIKGKDFKNVLQKPKSVAIGVISQFIALPALTFLLVYIFGPVPSIGLGMILVAASPGGNISNFICSLSKANVALSVTLTSIATVLAVFMTPINFSFWGGILPETANILTEVNLDFMKMLKTISLLIALPLVLGMLFNQFLPRITEKIVKPIKVLSIIIFIAFIVVAFISNFDAFLENIHRIIFIVFVHNAVAFATGFALAKIGRLPTQDAKSISIETGIQNSGLSLILIFNFFEGMGGMALVAAWWGVWHIISGLTLSWFFQKKLSS
ncbi:MAG: bile acid:sodium symporter family protein [Flavobacteriales bacterium]|nr:bile acid:sodium symporter family protein [Flavobacteriales bacterium]